MQLDVWNAEQSELYDRMYGNLPVHQDIVRALNVTPGMRVLDIGAGGGYLSLCLAEQGAEVISLDPSPAMCQLAQVRRKTLNKASQWRIVNTDIESYSAEPATIDVAIAAFSSHHWQDLNRGLSVVLTSLKPGACLWIWEDLDIPSEYAEHALSCENSPDEASPGAKFELKTLNTQLNELGFKVTRSEDYRGVDGHFATVCAQKTGVKV